MYVAEKCFGREVFVGLFEYYSSGIGLENSIAIDVLETEDETVFEHLCSRSRLEACSGYSESDSEG